MVGNVGYNATNADFEGVIWFRFDASVLDLRNYKLFATTRSAVTGT